MRFVIAVMMEIEAKTEETALHLAQGLCEVGAEGAKTPELSCQVVAVHPPLRVPDEYLKQARKLLSGRRH